MQLKEYQSSTVVLVVPVHSFMQECELNQHARYYSIINEHITKIMEIITKIDF